MRNWFERIIVTAISFWIGLLINSSKGDVVFDGVASDDSFDVHEMVEFHNEMNRRDTGKCPACPDCYQDRWYP
jgi:hypothetical protein